MQTIWLLRIARCFLRKLVCEFRSQASCVVMPLYKASCIAKYTTRMQKLSCSGFTAANHDGGICLATQSVNAHMGLHDTDHLQRAC